MTEPWHDECRRLRAGGLSQPDIAARLNQSREAVRLALGETLEQRMALRRIKERTRSHTRRECKAGKRFQTYWTARATAPSAITPDIKREAILAFSKHEIDRGELMRRITPRDKWSGSGLLRME